MPKTGDKWMPCSLLEPCAGKLARTVLRGRGTSDGSLLPGGAWAVEAPTRQIKPSQTCHACGQQEKKPLSQRRHSCPCGASCSRDENAARVLLAWLERSLSGREPADAWREVRPGHPLDESALPSKRETHAIA
ncbi:hypothetical protein CKO15_12880 [Halorhodospira abdelmalekii]|uniref:zinc ribbon domain-containing protein n=1 Tax=Halorhodospira abdelmalekii TaxID=421629 RepID=UPI003B8481B8|nr:hypothetical protein [Halorhodospira abdelmalekii]